MGKIKNGIYAWRFRDGDYCGAWIKIRDNKSLRNFISDNLKSGQLSNQSTCICNFKDNLIWDDYFPAKYWINNDLATIINKEYYIKGVRVSEQEFIENKLNLYLVDALSN